MVRSPSTAEIAACHERQVDKAFSVWTCLVRCFLLRGCKRQTMRGEEEKLLMKRESERLKRKVVAKQGNTEEIYRDTAS